MYGVNHIQHNISNFNENGYVEITITVSWDANSSSLCSDNKAEFYVAGKLVETRNLNIGPWSGGGSSAFTYKGEINSGQNIYIRTYGTGGDFNGNFSQKCTSTFIPIKF